MTKAQRDFLQSAAADALPITFTDSSGTFSVFLSRLRFDSPHKREDRAEQRAELTLAGATGAPWTNTQAEFLRQCADDIIPLTYTDPDGRIYPVILTRLNWQVPYKGPRGIEPVMQLRMVEARAGHWVSYAEAFMAAACSYSIVLSDPLDPNVYGSGTYGYGVYG